MFTVTCRTRGVTTKLATYPTRAEADSARDYIAAGYRLAVPGATIRRDAHLRLVMLDGREVARFATYTGEYS